MPSRTSGAVGSNPGAPSKWRVLPDDIEPGRVTRYRLLHDDELLTYERVVDYWRRSEAFGRFFGAVLASSPCRALFWETRPVTAGTLGEPFEFVLVDSPTLAAARADAAPFAHVLRDAGDGRDVIGFANLGHDAWLVAPRALGPAAHYAHLAAFVRGAPERQQLALWRAVGDAVAGRVGPAPLWVSTSGLGVCWLHVRLDSAPKYYTFGGYRAWPGR